MAAVNYTIRIDETDKQKAEEVFRELGMTFATGLNIYIKTVGRQQKIPFDLDINQKTARGNLKKAFEEAQEQSVINGTDNMTMEEIDAEIAAYRKEKLRS